MNNRKVLSLKYRPQNFDQLIGQESMSTAIQNAIEMDRVPNAYLLTGIRGVGKTTTARIIAKAINCNKKLEVKKNVPKKNIVIARLLSILAIWIFWKWMLPPKLELMT